MLNENTNPFETEPQFNQSENLRMAIYYAEMFKWPVFPVHHPVEDGCSCLNEKKTACNTIGKHSIIKDWGNKASTNVDQIIDWWTRFPDANIGIPTGMNTFYVLDVDISSGKPGQESLDQLINEHGELPRTLSATTGSGGKHYCFWIDTEEKIGNKVGFIDGLDFRGDGGCIIVEPSLHKSGHRYKWDNIKDQELYDIMEEMPSWLLNLITEDKSKKTKPVNLNPNSNLPFDLSIRNGERNDSLFRIGCSMRNDGAGESAILKSLTEINQTIDDPVDDQEIQLIANGISRYEPGKHTQIPKLDLGEYVNELFDSYKQVGRNELLGLKLNKFKQLASSIRGIQDGFYLIPGESGAGKTMLLTNLFWDLIESNDVMGYYISLDDPTKTIINRSLACLSGVTINDVQQLKGCDGEIKQVSVAVNKIQNYIQQGRVNIYDVSQINHIKQLFSLAESLNKKFFICIDGMYNINVGKYSNSRDENIKRANELKKLADIYHIPVICTGEVRKGDGKGKRKIGNDDIMESGKFIYNPNVILILTKIMLNDVFTGQHNLFCSKNKLSGFDGDIILNIDKDKCQITEQQEKF